MCQCCPAIKPADPNDPETRLSSRRAVLTGTAALAAAGFVATPAWAGTKPKPTGGARTSLMVFGTTDLHSHAVNWDYYKNQEYDDAAHNDVGVAQVATLLDAAREQYAGLAQLTLDAGDTIQGTPLGYYYAVVDPITSTKKHPMANAMNLLGYDAAALGNHEFNYGIPLLRTWQQQLNFPLLGANAVDPATKRPVFTPYVIKTMRPADAPAFKVGILGLTNPGIAIWDKANVEGKMEFPGLVEQAKKFVPEMKAKGADVVVVVAHSGMDTSSSYGPDLPPENASTLIAQQVAGVDAILVGHAHQDIEQRLVDSQVTPGKQVLLSEPYYWGMRLSVMQIDLQFHGGKWSVVGGHAQNLNSKVAKPKQAVVDAVAAQHKTVVDYVNSKIGTCTEQLSAARAPVEDVPIIDFINYVQADAVKSALGAANTLPVLSIAAPFNRSATFPAGDVTLRDVAGLYIYDNTLLGIQLSGAEVKNYLEWSMRYFKDDLTNAGPWPIGAVTKAVRPDAQNGMPDYNFDSMAGLDAPLTYDVDLAQPILSRVENLQYGGVPVADDQQFVVAINNYRQSGGGGFPGVKTAPVLYNRQVAITQLLIDWVTAHQVIDPAQFASVDWRLVFDGQPMTVTT